MKKKCLAVILLLTCMCVFGACGDSNAKKGVSSQGSEESEEKSTDVHVEFELSEGFTASDTEGMYFSSNYPEDGSNISMLSAESDSTSLKMDAETLSSAVEKQYFSQYQFETDVNCTECSPTKVDGYDALTARMEYEIQGVAVKQVECVVQIGEGTTTITYTQMGDANWMDAFEASMKSIKIVAN